MTETAGELAAEHTRRELEGMAEKLGIGTIGIGNKVSLAAAIIKAKEKASAKEMPKPKAEVKARVKPAIGKKGVFAKRTAIDAQIKENEEAVVVFGAGVREIESGIKDMRSAMDDKAMEMQKGVDEMHKSIHAQIKANEKAAAKMGIGVKEMHKGIKKFQSAIGNKTIELQNGVKEMYSGIKVIQTGIQDMETKFREYQNETASYIKDFYYG